MKYTTLAILTGAAFLTSADARAQQPSKWTLDVSLYGFAAGMSGDVAVKGVPAEVDFGFDQVWDNLDFAMMGKVRVGYERWALTADVVYMDLSASRNSLTVGMEQLMVEPTLSYTVCTGFEVLAGARYNNIYADIRGPLGLNPGGTEEWWDPIVGANLGLPLGKKFSLNARADIGGFGLGSDLTWQAYPFLSWQFAKWGSLQAGYRWMYVDYDTGSGTSQFKYDMLIEGPQLGITFSF